MARVRDLWFSEVKDPTDPEGKRKIKKKTAKHPHNGGNPDAGRWLSVWIAPDGKEKSKAFKNKEKAKGHGSTMEADVERGEYIDPKAGKVLFGDLGRRSLRLRKVGAGTAQRYESAFRLHIEPVFGHRQVSSIKPSEVLEWMLDLAERRGHGTQAITYIIVAGIFDLAVADGMRKDNPARSPIITPPHHETPVRSAWTVEQIWAVADAHPEPYRAIPIVSAGCGLRQGEAFGLALDDFDFEAGTVDIRRQLVKVGKTFAFKAPKGGKTRTAPLSKGVAQAVQTYIETYEPRDHTLPWMGEDGRLAEDEHTCKLLFRWHGDDQRTHGQHIRALSYDYGVWKPACVKAGVIPPPAKRPGRGRRLRYEVAREDGTHALRHYLATALLDAGVSLAGVMEFLGHSKKGKPITLGVYAHVTEETYDKARKAIDKSLFRLRAVKDRSESDGTVAELAVNR
jgi:integrase